MKPQRWLAAIGFALLSVSLALPAGAQDLQSVPPVAPAETPAPGFADTLAGATAPEPSSKPGPKLSLSAGAQTFTTRGTDREFWTARAALRFPLGSKLLGGSRCELAATQDPRASLTNARAAADLFRSIECASWLGWQISPRLRASGLGAVSFSVEGDYAGRLYGPSDPRLWTIGVGLTADFGERGRGGLYLSHHGPSCAPEQDVKAQPFCPTAILDVAYPSGVPKTELVVSLRFPFNRAVFDKRLYQLNAGAQATFWAKRPW